MFFCFYTLGYFSFFFFFSSRRRHTRLVSDWSSDVCSSDLIPEEPPQPWTVILSRGVDVWHTQYPGESLDALRISVVPEQGDHMEVLAFYFPIVTSDSTVLRLHWGTTIVPITIRAK